MDQKHILILILMGTDYSSGRNNLNCISQNRYEFSSKEKAEIALKHYQRVVYDGLRIDAKIFPV